MPRKTALIATAAIAWAGGLLTAYTLSAGAQEVAEPGDVQAQAPAMSSHLTCRLFLVSPEHRWTLETSDRTHEVGQWIGELEDSGWVLHDTELEIGQKATGYPQGYLHVCMAPA